MSKCTLLLVVCVSGALAQQVIPRGGPPPNNNNGQGGYQQGGNQGGGYQGNQGGGDLSFPSNPNAGASRGGINDACTSDTNCIVDGSYCKDRSFCSCKEDKVAINDNKECAPIVRDIGGQCKDDMQCKGGLNLGSACKSGTCQCISNYHFTDIDNNPRCAKTAKIGEICQDVGECTKKPDPSRMTCNNFCECKDPYKVSSDKTECSGATSLSTALSLLLVTLFARFAH